MNKKIKRPDVLLAVLPLLVWCITATPSSLHCQLFEDLDPEYNISSIQSTFPPWWEDDWEETVTGFRIMGSSFDLHTLHVLQHWKGQLPFTDYLLFTYDYFTDAAVDSELTNREIAFKYRFSPKHYVSLYGFPYFDKKQSDIGIRYSFEQTPFDLVRLSVLFEDAFNNYTFKDRDEDSMRIYTTKPIRVCFDVSVIKGQRHRFLLSYDLGLPYRVSCEDRDGSVRYRMSGKSSALSVIHKMFFADSGEWGWGIDFLGTIDDYFTPADSFTRSNYRIRFKPYIFIDERSESPLHLTTRLQYDLDEHWHAMNESISRTTFFVGIKTNLWSHSKLMLAYCRGSSRYFDEERTRRDNRLIFFADHRFENGARLGMNFGIDIDSRDTTHGVLGRYDKLFCFLQYPLSREIKKIF
jgi:hypothetical protein